MAVLRMARVNCNFEAGAQAIKLDLDCNLKFIFHTHILKKRPSRETCQSAFYYDTFLALYFFLLTHSEEKYLSEIGKSRTVTSCLP